MASCSGGRKKRLVSTLDGEVLERLSMKLNPRMLMKDYQSLAGRLKYPYEYIRNFERERDPTLALLHHWCTSKRGKEKTVSVLIEHLSDMERDDAVDLLRAHEFYSSHEASEYDDNSERPVIAGATDMNINPYNPHFPAREDHHQGKANQYGTSRPDVTARHNGHQTFPDQRENEQRQKNAPPPRINQAQWPGYDNSLHQDQLNQKMLNMKVHYNNNFPNNYPGMLPSTSTSFPNGSSPSSVSSSMDSVQFEKHFLDKEDVFRKSPLSPQYQAAEAPRLNADSSQPPYPVMPDEFYGARRDLRLHGVHNRPRPLDGSSMSSSEAGIPREFIVLPRRDRMMRDNRDTRGCEQYMGAGVDMRYWPGDYRQYEGMAAAESHSMTAAADKVALVIGNQDYCHEKLRGLLCPEKDAADVSNALRQLNFKVMSLVNLTLSEMRTAMLAFCCLLGRGVYGVVYYAGHGYEDNGENYLLPVDSDLKYNREHSLRTQEVLEAMQQCDTSLNLLIIDACRVSLPNKSGTKVPRIKRSTKGNNIFAYSCTSQQESGEVSTHENGMYCLHLLRRIRENRRVENVLMDVATDFALAYDLPQRPCLETDSKADFRLTDPIQSDMLEDEYSERCRRWSEAQQHPHPFSLPAGSVRLSLEFSARFSNVLCVSVVAEKRMDKSVTEFHLDLKVASPLSCKLKYGEIIEHGNIVCKQRYEIQNIQKHIKLQGPVMLTVEAMFKEDEKVCKYEKPLDLGWPLVSSITCLWDRWLLGDRCKSTAV